MDRSIATTNSISVILYNWHQYLYNYKYSNSNIRSYITSIRVCFILCIYCSTDWSKEVLLCPDGGHSGGCPVVDADRSFEEDDARLR